MYNTKYKVGDKILVECEIVNITANDGTLCNYQLDSTLDGSSWFRLSDLESLDKTPKDQKKERLQKQIEQKQEEIKRMQKEMEEL